MAGNFTALTVSDTATLQLAKELHYRHGLMHSSFAMVTDANSQKAMQRATRPSIESAAFLPEIQIHY